MSPKGEEGWMTDETNFERVRAFHQAVGGVAPKAPASPDAAILSLRQTLIREEYEEVAAAFEQALAARAAGEAIDIVPLAHELADLLYVAYGGLVELGVDGDKVFAEVHRANMDKVRGPKRADGKQLKPADWQPADVAAVIVGQRWVEEEGQASQA